MKRKHFALWSQALYYADILMHPGFAINVTNTAVGEVHLTLLSASIFSELL